MISLALYKGPPSGLINKLLHYAICIRTLSKYSHVELLIDDVCYSSSALDGGIRSKIINTNTKKWNVISLDLPQEQEQLALKWFLINDGKKYDWWNIVRYILPFVNHKENKYICFEAVGEALGFAGAYKLNGNDLEQWALSKQKKEL